MEHQSFESIEDLIADLTENEDVGELKRLLALVLEAGEETHEPGQMTQDIKVVPSRELIANMGLAPGAAEETAGFLNLANRLAHSIRWVEFRRDKRARPELPVIVAEGDSWFLHQLITDTLDHLREDEDPTRPAFNVRSLAAAGDTVENMLSSDNYIEALREEKSRIFLFSGGGNDLLGNGRIADVVKPHDPALSPEELIVDGKFDQFLDQVVKDYKRMIETVARDVPDVRIIAHGYDRLKRIDAGPWIWPYLVQMGYSKQRAVDVIEVLLDRFNSRLADLDRRYDSFSYLDLRGVVGNHPNCWYDAIHPRSTGFGKVATRFAFAARKALEAGPPRQGEFSEAAFGVSAPSTKQRRPTTVPLQTNEAISRFFGRRDRNDFENVRAAVQNMPPQSQWRRFKDPLVTKHILDVIDLLNNPSNGQDRDIVDNRLRTRPQAMVRDSEFGQPTAHQDERVSDLGSGWAEVELEMLEALFGDTEIEPIQIMLKGYQAGRAVGRVQVMNQHGLHIGHGSGFLVAPGIFLTNAHVLPSADIARRSFVVFEDETNLDGSLSRPVRFRFTDEVFWSSQILDYTFVSVEQINRDGVDSAQFGHLPLIRDSGKALTFEPVSIIQHPGGDPKAIAIRNSFIMGRKDDGIYYTTDTLGGSSGSPVLNREWQVVALHHRYVPHPTEADGVLANRGVRISRIYKDLVREDGHGTRMASIILRSIGGVRSMEFRWTHGNGAQAEQHSDTSPDSVVESGVYEGLNNDEFLAAISQIGADESDDIPLPAVLGGASNQSATEALSLDPVHVLRRIGDVGYRFIVAHEVSSRANYDKKLRHPILPGASSGITIGIGYDLGYTSISKFRRNWGDLLPEPDLRRLEACIGKKRKAARAMLSKVRSISIPYEQAVVVFERSSLPEYFGRLNRHVPDHILSALPVQCVAALVSLTFNRGASYQTTGDRYREMRGIRTALLQGRLHDVPELIRSMKRLWAGMANVRGLLRRRDEEAELFETGLSGSRPLGEDEHARVEIGHYDPTPDLDEESKIPIVSDFRETGAPRLSWSDVRWVRDFRNNPDYAHLPDAAQGKTFTLDASLIEQAIRLGHYDPHFTKRGHLIVAVRGAMLASGSQAEILRDTIDLKETSPDHRSFKCVIAVYHRDDGKISAFRASTVPNRGGVASCANLLNGHGGSLANALPTGCYRLCVGTHFGSVTVPTVLRLGSGTGPSTALEVTTLRTRNDGTYGTRDLWDRCKPADNIHPAFSAASAEFSSLGCLTIPGSFSPHGQSHSGAWAKFRQTAGFDGNQHMGVRYDLLLTTGMELAAIQQALGGTLDHLRRLAHGSTGQAVKDLQSALGVGVDGVFGPRTKESLVMKEAASANGKATGIYSVTSETDLGFGIFT